jgi:hypothetical protein
MSSLSDSARIREIIKRLDEIERESRMLREKIERIRARGVEFPPDADVQLLIDDLRRSASPRGQEGPTKSATS